MTISYIGAGTTPSATGTGTGSTSISPDITGNQSGDLLVLFVATKNTNTISTPAGWSTLDNISGGGGTTGVDTGPVRIAGFHKVSNGTETSVTVSISSGNSSWGQVFVYRSDYANHTWDLSSTSGTDSSTGSSWSVTGAGDPFWHINDHVLVGSAIPTDTDIPGKFSAGAITATGVTFSSLSLLSEPSTTNGNDMGGFIYRGTVASGNSSSAAPVFTATAGGTTTNVRGGTVMVRIRDVDLSENFYDTFDDNSVSSTKWWNWGNVTESSSKSSLTTQTGGSYQGMETWVGYDLRGSSVSVQATSAGNQALASLIYYPIMLNLGSTGSSDLLYWKISGNTIAAVKRVAGADTTLSSASYVAATHQWLRIRESGGTTFFDYSADGDSWTQLTSMANHTAGVDYCILGWNMFTSSEASTTTGTIDNFNSRSKSSSDTTSGSDATAPVINATLSSLDTVSVNETAAIGLSSSDTASSSESQNITVSVPSSDTATGSDATTPVVRVASSDTTSGIEASSITATLSSSDVTGGVAESGTVTANISNSDVSTGTDSNTTLTASLSSTDTTHGTENYFRTLNSVVMDTETLSDPILNDGSINLAHREIVLSDSLTLDDEIYRTSMLRPSDTVNLSDTWGRVLKLIFTDTETLADSYTRPAAYIKTTSSRFETYDSVSLRKGPILYFTDNETLNDEVDLPRSTPVLYTETVTLSDSIEITKEHGRLFQYIDYRVDVMEP